ncbi:MAG: CAP domain-containing protein [Phycisphaerales bacterium]
MPGSTSRFRRSVRAGRAVGLRRRAGGAGAGPLEQLEQRALLFSWTAQEVYLTELVNRARANPDAEGVRLGLDLRAGLSSAELARYGPQEPLALNQFLTTAARAHSLDMAARGFFDHVNPSGQSPTDRAQAAGYEGTAGENIAAGYSSIDAAHAAWLNSLGHRKNVLSLHASFDSSFHYDEFGPGLAFNVGGTYNHYQTEVFGYPGSTPVRYILGVVFNDADANQFYGIGEGADGVRVDVASSAAPSIILGTYTTDSAGNYQIPMGNGAFVVKFTRLTDGFTVTKSVTVVGQNVKVDARTQELQDPTPPVSDDYANAGQWSSAGLITLDAATGNGLKSGLFEAGGDTDLFRFTATRTGVTRISLMNPGGASSAAMRVYNSSQTQIAVGTASDGSLSALVTLTEGQTYYLLAESLNPASVGQYLIDLVGPGPVDDHADAGEWSGATVIQLSGDGAGAGSGTLEVPGDTDLFRFTAGGSGLVTLTVASPSSAFAASITAFGQTQGELGSAAASSAGSAATLTLNVVSGQTYYLLVGSASGSATGAFSLSVGPPVVQPSTDDHADEGQWTSATPISLVSGTGVFFRVAYLESAGDTDLFRFTANRTGRARVTMQHPSGAMVTRVRIFAADYSLVGEGTPGSGAEGNSTADFEITSGLTYYILAAAADEDSVGVYTLEMANLDPLPVVVTNGERASWDQRITSTVIGGRLSVGYVNFWGRPVLATQQANGSWTMVDLITEAPSINGAGFTGGFLRWDDRRDGTSHIAIRSTRGLLLFTQADGGPWTVRNLTSELPIAHMPSSDLSLYIDGSGRANIAATNAVGDVILYCQTVKRRADGSWRWKYRNLTHSDLERVNVEMPFIASELVTWVTPQQSLNITFLDLDGNILNFFKTRSDKFWSLGNISQAAGTAPLVGEVSVMQMRNRTVQITGTTEDGHVWATTFREGRGWTSRDLTARFEADPARVRSQVAYVNKAGVGFVAMIKENGKLSLFRYAAAKDRWVYQDVNLTPPDFRLMLGRLQAVVDRETEEVHLVGTLDSARVVRWTWAPGRPWAFEDISYRLASAQ